MASTARACRRGLCSQRFYDDCFDMLQPGGIMVVNLHHGHVRYSIHLDRIRRSFKEAVLVVDDGELSNASYLRARDTPSGKCGRASCAAPRTLPDNAAKQLLAAFALIATALKDQQR